MDDKIARKWASCGRIWGIKKRNSRCNVCGGQTEKRGDPQEMSLDLYRGPDLWAFLPT